MSKIEWDGQPIPNLYHIIGVLKGINAYLRSGTLDNAIDYLELLIKYFEKYPVQQEDDEKKP